MNHWSNYLKKTSTLSEASNVHCDECIKDIDAVGSCVDCHKNYCSYHIESHHKSRSTFQHKIILTKEDDSYCTEHKSEKLSLFCVDEGCGKFLCTQCIKGSSHHVIHLSDFATQVKGKLKEYLEISTKRRNELSQLTQKEEEKEREFSNSKKKKS